MKKKALSLLLCFSMMFPMFSAMGLPAASAAGSLEGTGPEWKAVYPANNQNDYLQDQQTGSDSVSQDIVGDATYPSTYMHFTNEELSIRMRVSNANGNNAIEFKNFAFTWNGCGSERYRRSFPRRV